MEDGGEAATTPLWSSRLDAVNDRRCQKVPACPYSLLPCTQFCFLTADPAEPPPCHARPTTQRTDTSSMGFSSSSPSWPRSGSLATLLQPSNFPFRPFLSQIPPRSGGPAPLQSPYSTPPLSDYTPNKVCTVEGEEPSGFRAEFLA